MNDLDKWQFCPDKECFNCDADLTDNEECKKEKVVSGCPYCHYSFVE